MTQWVELVSRLEAQVRWSCTDMCSVRDVSASMSIHWPIRRITFWTSNRSHCSITIRRNQKTNTLDCVSNGFRLEKLRLSDSANGSVKDCFLCRGTWSKTEFLRLLGGILQLEVDEVSYDILNFALQSTEIWNWKFSYFYSCYVCLVLPQFEIAKTRLFIDRPSIN